MWTCRASLRRALKDPLKSHISELSSPARNMGVVGSVFEIASRVKNVLAIEATGAKTREPSSLSM